MRLFKKIREYRDQLTGIGVANHLLKIVLQGLTDVRQELTDVRLGITNVKQELTDVRLDLTNVSQELAGIRQELDAVFTSIKRAERDAKNRPSTETLVELIGQLRFEIAQERLLGSPASPAGSLDSITNSLSQRYDELEARKKFAFLIHDPIMLVHYRDVWKAMGSSNFVIVVTEYFSTDENGNEKLGMPSFSNHVHAEGYEVRKITELINCGIKFEYVVTNHIISGSTRLAQPATSDDNLKKLLNRGLALMGKAAIWEFGVDINTYLPLQVGNKQIRYMYGADISDGWSLQGWNDIYDVFLCHGVNDERVFKERFKGKTFVMGYPRYDRFFAEDIDLSFITKEFNISESKKTILWMPTLGGDYSSIPLFAEPLSVLSEKYNIIVRPHPFSFAQEKDFILLLENFNFSIDRNALRDMNELFGVADVILADNGGTPFSAIFLGKNVIFLDVPEPDVNAKSTSASVIAGSSVMGLKEYLPVIGQQEIDRLESMLESRKFYKENDECVDKLFRRYFDSPRGGGAHRVADFFISL